MWTMSSRVGLQRRWNLGGKPYDHLAYHRSLDRLSGGMGDAEMGGTIKGSGGNRRLINLPELRESHVSDAPVTIDPVGPRKHFRTQYGV